jgi:hypothetical protein
LHVKATDKFNQADASRDSAEQEDLRMSGDDLEFVSFFAVGVGAALTLTGVIMLAIPEEGAARGEIIGVAPRRGGGLLTWTGRF